MIKERHKHYIKILIIYTIVIAILIRTLPYTSRYFDNAVPCVSDFFLFFYDFGFCLRSFFWQWAQWLQLSQPVQPQLLCRIKARTARNSAVPMAASSRMSQIFTAALRFRGTQRQPPTQSNTATAPVRQPTCRPVPAARRPPPPRRGCTAG